MKPGDRWHDLEFDLGTYEGLALVNGDALPVSVVIAAELLADDADWAFLVVVHTGRLTLLDATATCVPVEGAPADLLGRLRQANGGRLVGFPDAIGMRGSTVLMREAKRPGDRVQPQHHAFARVAAGLLGDDLDLAVVVWDLPLSD